MDIKSLNENERKKFKTLVKLMKDEFGIIPVELEDAIEGVKEASKKTEAYAGNFFLEYVMPNPNSHEMCLDIYHNMTEGLTFERALAQCLCEW